MVEDKFEVLLGDVVVAKDMDMATVLILVKGMFDAYYAEPNMRITIMRYVDEE